MAWLNGTVYHEAAFIGLNCKLVLYQIISLVSKPHKHTVGSNVVSIFFFLSSSEADRVVIISDKPDIVFLLDLYAEAPIKNRMLRATEDT